LASNDVNHGLTRIVVDDGDTQVDTAAGLEYRRNVNPADDYYIYFR
jgi:hypothetical protein